MSTAETTEVVATIQTTEIAGETESPPVVYREQVTEYGSYGEAAQAACRFVNPPPNEQQLKFYISRLGPATGKKVGLGLPGTSSVLDLVRLDNDNSGKGIHFNARQRAGDNSNKLAAVIRSTIAMTPDARQTQYNRWIADLQDIAASVTLWNAWRAGRMPRDAVLAGEASEVVEVGEGEGEGASADACDAPAAE